MAISRPKIGQPTARAGVRIANKKACALTPSTTLQQPQIADEAVSPGAFVEFAPVRTPQKKCELHKVPDLYRGTTDRGTRTAVDFSVMWPPAPPGGQHNSG